MALTLGVYPRSLASRFTASPAPARTRNQRASPRPSKKRENPRTSPATYIWELDQISFKTLYIGQENVGLQRNTPRWENVALKHTNWCKSNHQGGIHWVLKIEGRHVDY